jgi:hypothetical protein
MKKSITILLVFIFSLSLLAASGFSQTDCGQVCCCSSKMHAMQHATKFQARAGTDCCSQTAAHACGIAKNRNVELPLCTISAGRINTGTSLSASHVTNAAVAVKEVDLARDGEPVAKIPKPPSPLYLQHLTLLI